MSDDAEPESFPSQEEFILLLQDLRRRIERLLRRDGGPPETDSPFLREAVLGITQRWRRGRRNGREPFDETEKPGFREPESPAPEEPRDDEEPPT